MTTDSTTDIHPWSTDNFHSKPHLNHTSSFTPVFPSLQSFELFSLCCWWLRDPVWINMHDRDLWGGLLVINTADSATNDDRSRDLDRVALSHLLDETRKSWLLGPEKRKKKKRKYVDLGCIIISWWVNFLPSHGVLKDKVQRKHKNVHHDFFGKTNELTFCQKLTFEPLMKKNSQWKTRRPWKVE